MLSIGTGRIFLATAPVDMRRGHDGLEAFVCSELGADPYQGDLFVFVGRTRDRLKILSWERGGFVLIYKRLARGEPPPNPWTNLLNQIHGKACPDVRAEESSPTASV